MRAKTSLRPARRRMLVLLLGLPVALALVALAIVWAALPTSTTVAPFQNGVLPPTISTITPDTTTLAPNSSLLTPVSNTAEASTDDLTATTQSADGFVSGLPGESSAGALVPSTADTAGFTSGLPATSSVEAIVATTSSSDGFPSGVPATASTQTLEPSTVNVTGIASGGTVASSTVTPSSQPRPPTSEAVEPFQNAVRAPSGQELDPPTPFPASPASTESDPFTNGVHGPGTSIVPCERDDGSDCPAVGEVEGPPGDATCSDGIDNDGDDQIDYADPDCWYLGDVNCDGFVNVIDALFILQYEVGMRAATEQCPLPTQPAPPPAIGWLNVANCDVSGDGLCNVVDALFILQCEVGLPPGADMPFCLAAAQVAQREATTYDYSNRR